MQTFPRVSFLSWLCVLAIVALSIVASAPLASAQSTAASVYGRVTDPTNAVLTGVEVEIKNTATGVSQTTTTNGEGFYSFPFVEPGNYLMTISKAQFRTVSVTGITLNVQDNLSRNFVLQVGSATESITVTGEGVNINTTDASVSTVIDRQFVADMPLNGRTMQNLIYLTPGVVLTPTSANDLGQFSVNGQRTDANYFTIDGVSANIGTAGPPVQLGQGAGGAVPGLSVLGGTNNLVSMDGMEEFRIQTSSYAPEFGRAPGGQISVVTRSGTNDWHGRAFEYVRNDIFDANDWFSNEAGLPKSEERQNDFGGVVGGPIIKDHTFFFLSYEALRLRLPQTGITSVPSMATRQSAPANIQPFLDAFPQPNGADQGNGLAAFDAGFSNSASLDALSVRVDHKVGENLHLFGRYNYAPSSLNQRGAGSFSLNDVVSQDFNTQTATVGGTWTVAPSIANDFRFNYSRNSASTADSLDTFGGAVVPSSGVLFPSPFSTANGHVNIYVLGGTQTILGIGSFGSNLQRQFNLIDSVSITRGRHALKFGIDYRRLSPEYAPPAYEQFNNFLSVPQLVSGSLQSGSVAASRSATILFHNVGAFGQDSWKITPRLTATYGLRWDVDVSPSSATPGVQLLAVTGFEQLSTLALAPAGTPLFRTTLGNVAPRVGMAYAIRQKPGRETVVRGGFGVFYDLASQKVGDALVGTYPFSMNSSLPEGTAFPLSPQNAQPPPIELTLPIGSLTAPDPHLKLPYTLQWNVAVQQALGPTQAVSVSYVGSAGRRLILQEQLFSPPNPAFAGAPVNLLRNGSTSDYDALQVQYNRALSRGFQALASYSWSHCIDTASTDSMAPDVTFTRGLGQNLDRGACNFDIRNAATAGVTYDIPSPGSAKWTAELLRNWSIDTEVIARSAAPVDVVDFDFFETVGTSPVSTAYLRPDLVPGQPVYLFGPAYPGGKAFNPNAFTDPPLDPSTGFPTRQGDLGRNVLRGFGATQWDFALHRSFNLSERVRLEFRAEFFNLLNHPNFGQPQNAFTKPVSPSFGVSTAMLGRSLSNDGQGLNPLYQIGGPRSIQLALRLNF